VSGGAPPAQLMWPARIVRVDQACLSIIQKQPRIHASRLVVFPVVRVPSYQVQTGLAGPSWGDSF
jgi:hypothetical protein